MTPADVMQPLASRRELKLIYTSTCDIGELRPGTPLIVDQGNTEGWVKAACECATTEQQILCLVPARTNTGYWHNIILKRAESITFVRGRLQFPGHNKQSPTPSAIVRFGGQRQGVSWTSTTQMFF